LIESNASKLGLSRFDSCDLIVQCGAPVLWPGCHRAEWAESLWHRVVGRLSGRIPALNLASGSAYPWEDQPSHISDFRDVQFLKDILGYCTLTTVRDRLARDLCRSLGTETPLIPCAAFLSAGDRAAQNEEKNLVLINYMRGGGHFDFGQNIDPEIWEKTVKTLIDRMKTRHKLAFLCHNDKEYGLARELDPTLPRLWPKTPEEYFFVVSKAKTALCNRMHASVGLAGVGIPSVAVCTDSRLLMVDALGLPYIYVKFARADELESMLEDLITRRAFWKESLMNLRAKTMRDYIHTLEAVL
jgi:hypothetical protein